MMGKLSTLNKKLHTHTQREIDFLARFKIFARLKFCVNNNNNKNY